MPRVGALMAANSRAEVWARVTALRRARTSASRPAGRFVHLCRLCRPPRFAMHVLDYDAATSRALSRSIFARQYVWRFSFFRRLICPSVCPFDQGSGHARGGCEYLDRQGGQTTDVRHGLQSPRRISRRRERLERPGLCFDPSRLSGDLRQQIPELCNNKRGQITGGVAEHRLDPLDI